MKTDQDQTTEELKKRNHQLHLASGAIRHVLARIAEDPNIRWHMGDMTESYTRLRAAHAAIHDVSPETIDEQVIARELHGRVNAPIVQAIESALGDYHIALRRREHGGIAADKLIKEIEKAFGRNFEGPLKGGE